ncbi:MAG TPA: hypothetical protein VND64_23445 [Pirellulales bacterium]|nr:hypothetical protein [Pirellulales bacterium]
MQRRASDGDSRPWADPGARGTAVCAAALLDHPTANAQDARVFMTAHVFCRGAYYGAAKVVIVRGHAPMQWLDDVVSEAVARTLEGLQEQNWRAILERGIDHFPAWLASYALHRCQEGLSVLRPEIGDARWAGVMRRVVIASWAIEERDAKPEPRQDLFEGVFP